MPTLKRTIAPGRAGPAVIAAILAFTAGVPGTAFGADAPAAVEKETSEPGRKGDEDQAAAVRAPPGAVVSASKDGIQIRSNDGNLILKLKALSQVDGRFFVHDPMNAQTGGFLLRRARLILEGTVYRIFDFRISPDFGGGTTVLQDAYIEARFFPWLKLRCGKFKSPLGLERLQGAKDLAFLERALPTNLVPNRDLGLQLSGDIEDGLFSYQAALLNGVPDGSSADVDTNSGKEVVARLFCLPFLKTHLTGLKGLGIGVAASTGVNQGTPAATGLSSYKSSGQVNFFSYRTGSTVASAVVTDGRRERFSSQAYFYRGRFGAFGEFVRSTHEVRKGDAPAIETARLTNRSRELTGLFLLTDDIESWKGITPKRNFDLAAHGWGALELVVRYGRLDLDPLSFPDFADPARSARSATEFAGGINWYLNPNIKWMTGYSQTRFQGGAPPAIGESRPSDREPERVIQTRFQIAF